MFFDCGSIPHSFIYFQWLNSHVWCLNPRSLAVTSSFFRWIAMFYGQMLLTWSLPKTICSILVFYVSMVYEMIEIGMNSTSSTHSTHVQHDLTWLSPWPLAFTSSNREGPHRQHTGLVATSLSWQDPCAPDGQVGWVANLSIRIIRMILLKSGLSMSKHVKDLQNTVNSRLRCRILSLKINFCNRWSHCRQFYEGEQFIDSLGLEIWLLVLPTSKWSFAKFIAAAFRVLRCDMLRSLTVCNLWLSWFGEFRQRKRPERLSAADFWERPKNCWQK